MITLEQAREQAAAIVRSVAGASAELRADPILEGKTCWVFVYGRLNRDALIGNSPVLVNRQTGRVTLADTSLPIALFVEAYDALGAERFEQGAWRDYLRAHLEDLGYPFTC